MLFNYPPRRSSAGLVFKLIAILIMLICVQFGVARVHAEPLDERDFWQRLQQTSSALQQALAQPSQRNALLANVRGLWQSVDSVRLGDGTVIAVDLHWLVTGLSDEESESTQQLANHVQALLAYHQRQGGRIIDANDSLETLKRVLQDPRFSYPEVTPTAIPTPEPATQQQDQNADESPLAKLLTAQIGQLLLVISGIIAVFALLVYFGRNLRVQRAVLPPAEEIDDPTTSEEANDLASGSEASQDYRRAIRFLYLSSLLLLDERGLIHYDRSLTNREHLRQIIDKRELSEALRPVVNTFDRVWYGFAPVDEALYQEFRQNVERLRQVTP
ncbi:MAG: DUF4129 domain-containing protein [Chloroflexota bacterium]